MPGFPLLFLGPMSHDRPSLFLTCLSHFCSSNDPVACLTLSLPAPHLVSRSWIILFYWLSWLHCWISYPREYFTNYNIRFHCMFDFTACSAVNHYMNCFVQNKLRSFPRCGSESFGYAPGHGVPCHTFSDQGLPEWLEHQVSFAPRHCQLRQVSSLWYSKKKYNRSKLLNLYSHQFRTYRTWRVLLTHHIASFDCCITLFACFLEKILLPQYTSFKSCWVMTYDVLLHLDWYI